MGAYPSFAAAEKRVEALRLDEAYAHAQADWDAVAEAAWSAALPKLMTVVDRYKAERDAARESAKEWALKAAQACSERDEAQDERDAAREALKRARAALLDAPTARMARREAIDVICGELDRIERAALKDAPRLATVIIEADDPPTWANEDLSAYDDGGEPR